MYGIGAWTRRPRLLVVYVRYRGTDKKTTSLGSECTVLGNRQDDQVSWWFMNGIGVRTRRPRILVVCEQYCGKD